MELLPLSLVPALVRNGGAPAQDRALNLKFARFPVLRRHSDIDFDAQPVLDRRIIDELATARFLSEDRDLVFLGPPGAGETHPAIALGLMVCEIGHGVYFTIRLNPIPPTELLTESADTTTQPG
jgi:hypothetical protein